MNYFRNKHLYSIIFLFISLSALSQNSAIVKGFVYDKANGEPVPFCNVYFKGTTIGANTDLNGFFTITKVPPGIYKLLITNLDFDTTKETITINAGDIVYKKFFANKGGIKLDEIEVSTTSVDKIENTSVAVQKIDPIIINKLPKNNPVETFA